MNYLAKIAIENADRRVTYYTRKLRRAAAQGSTRQHILGLALQLVEHNTELETLRDRYQRPDEGQCPRVLGNARGRRQLTRKGGR
jgi:hypothetical protein